MPIVAGGQALPPNGPTGRTAADAPQGENNINFERISMEAKYKSLEDMWNQYFGKGKFEGQPMVGGFDAMEKTFKSKWRKHLDSRRFNECKQVVKGIKAAAVRLGMSEETALWTFDKMYQNELRQSMKKVVAKLQEDGHLSVRPRSSIQE